MGIEWQRNIFPKLDPDSTGQEMINLTDHFDKTGEWNWDLISNPVIRLGARSTMEGSRSAIAGDLLRKADRANSSMAEQASAYKVNKLGNVYNPWSDWHDKDERAKIGPYSIGAYNLIPNYVRGQTFDSSLDNFKRPPTRKDIVPTTVWHALGLEKKED
tara:strand:+ start:94 stop:570 length:477 start_codon:yes stop_codon:yes gene_type:complete